MIKFYLWLFKKILNRLSKKPIYPETLYQIIHDVYIAKLSKIDFHGYQLNVECALARGFERTQTIKSERVLLHDVANVIDREQELEGEPPERFKKVIMEAKPDKIMRLLQLTVKVTKEDIKKNIIKLRRY